MIRFIFHFWSKINKREERGSCNKNVSVSIFKKNYLRGGDVYSGVESIQKNFMAPFYE